MTMHLVRCRHLFFALLLFSVSALSACSRPPEVPMGSELTQEGVSVAVTNIEARLLELEGPEGAVVSERPALIIHVRVTNAGTEAVTWNLGWDVAQATQAQHALLFGASSWQDGLSPANNIPNLNFDAGYTWPGDPVTEPVVLQPGESLEDRLLYTMPPQGTASLVLSLPPRVFGSLAKMPGYITIPWSTPTIEELPVLSHEETWTGDGFTFQITGTSHEWSELIQGSNEGISNNALFRINFRVTNTGETPARYTPTRSGNNIAFPRLRDASGTMTVSRATFSADITVKGQKNSAELIQPGASLEDFILFDTPSSSISSLLLEFPARRFDRNGTVRMTFPYAHRTPEKPEPWRTAEAAP